MTAKGTRGLESPGFEAHPCQWVGSGTSPPPACEHDCVARERINTGVWTRRAKRRAWACGVGGFLAVASCVAVIAPQIRVWGGGHGLGGWIAEVLFGPCSARVSPFWIDWVVARDADGFASVGDIHSPEAQQAIRRVSDGGDDVWICNLYEYRFPAGLWGPTREQQVATLRTDVWSHVQHTHPHGNLSDAEVEHVRSVALEAIRGTWGSLRWPESKADLIASGVWTGTEVAPWGWFLNAGTILGFLTFAVTAPLTFRDIRRHRRALAFLRDGRCGWCGYDVRGLAPEATVCPECGKPMRESPPGHASRRESARSACFAPDSR